MTATFRELGENTLRDSLAKLLSHREEVLAGEDIEAIHDMRVASRRLRAAISIFGPCFPDPDFARFEREVKAVTSELGRARDLDVMIDSLERRANETSAGQAALLREMAQEKRTERSKQQARVVKCMNGLSGSRLLDRLEAIMRRWRPIEEGFAEPWPGDSPPAEDEP